jgi:hypothetical protein
MCAVALCCSACGPQAASSGPSAPAPPDAAVISNAPAAAAPVTAPEATSVAAPPDASSCLPSHDGYLRLRMRGARNMDIDWHDADMQCDGGPRPGQQGLRLTFAGPAHGDARNRGGHNLRFVFGIAAGPGARSAHNVPANVTVIFEGEHKLFSTAGDGKCTIDEFSEQPLPPQAHSRLRRLSARGFCVAPATALAGSSALLLSRFDFAGAILDEDPADEPPAATP